jgi:hypothetical protein
MILGILVGSADLRPKIKWGWLDEFLFVNRKA